jgi:hypothetical protein
LSECFEKVLEVVDLPSVHTQTKAACSRIHSWDLSGAFQCSGVAEREIFGVIFPGKKSWTRFRLSTKTQGRFYEGVLQNRTSKHSRTFKV